MRGRWVPSSVLKHAPYTRLSFQTHFNWFDLFMCTHVYCLSIDRLPQHGIQWNCAFNAASKAIAVIQQSHTMCLLIEFTRIDYQHVFKFVSWVNIEFRWNISFNTFNTFNKQVKIPHISDLWCEGRADDRFVSRCARKLCANGIHACITIHSITYRSMLINESGFDMHTNMYVNLQMLDISC